MSNRTCTLLVGVICVLLAGAVSDGQSADESLDAPSVTKSDTATPVAFSEESARLQAASLHEAMHSALQVTHDRYYREDEGLPIPASVMKEVFDDIKAKRNITLRWLAVEGQAMNTDHRPRDEFEKQAVKVLKSGKQVHEQLEKGVYRRAGAITLSNHCLKCHVPDRRSTRDRTAGLIISMPLE